MEMKGFVQVKREIEYLFEKLPRKKRANGRAFLDYLFRNCNHTDAEIEIDGVGKETIKRGQIWTGRKTLAEKIGVGETVIRTMWKFFEKRGYIAIIKSTKHGSLISLLIYDEYIAKKEDLKENINQQIDQQTNQRLTNNHPVISQHLTTNNNVNNDYNVNNIKREYIVSEYEDIDSKEDDDSRYEINYLLNELEEENKDLVEKLETLYPILRGNSKIINHKLELDITNELLKIYYDKEFMFNNRKYSLGIGLFFLGLDYLIQNKIFDWQYLKKFWIQKKYEFEKNK